MCEECRNGHHGYCRGCPCRADVHHRPALPFIRPGTTGAAGGDGTAGGRVGHDEHRPAT